jgi:D-alanyl-D-alanine carboxypeptidase
MVNWRRSGVAVFLAMRLCQISQAASSPSVAELASCMANAAKILPFNGAVYARHGDDVVERFFGTSDAAARLPVSAATRFDIGSAGKMFTAVAIGLLIDRRAVDLEAPVGRYLNGLPAPLADVTITQLLTHMSGLGDYLDPKNKAQIESATTATELLPLAVAGALAFQPGTKRAYSNSGFVVLGAVIEKVSGLTYSRFVTQEILEPLRMTQTSLERAGSADPMTHMSPNGWTVDPRLSPLRLEHASPAGGMFSTAHDLSLFLTGIQAGGLVSRATLDTLLAPRADPGGGRPYGLGFVTRTEPHARVGHGGGAPGVNAEVDFFPDGGWQLIALSNNDPPTATRMVDVLEETVFADDPVAACSQALRGNIPRTVGAPAR